MPYKNRMFTLLNFKKWIPTKCSIPMWAIALLLMSPHSGLVSSALWANPVLQPPAPIQPTASESIRRTNEPTVPILNTELPKLLTVENSFIKLIVNNTDEGKGRFSIETTNGRPDTKADDNQVLIYGKPVPWTSYTSFKIDGKPVLFGTPSSKSTQRFISTPNYTVFDAHKVGSEKIESDAHYNGIHIKQTLAFYRNPNSKVKDAVLISYTLTNTDTQPHDVGINLLLDTKLGENDGAPLRLGSRAIATETQVSTEKLDDYWLAFDSLASPNIIAQGMFRSEELVTPPDIVSLANWGSLHDENWDYQVQEGRSFIRVGELEKDTALALRWNPKPLKPNETRTVQTLYGVGNISLSPGELSLGLTAPKEIFTSSSKQFSAVAYIANTGSFESTNTTITLTLPPAFSSLSPLKATIGTLKAGDTTQVQFKFKVKPGTLPGTSTLTLTTHSDTLESNTLTRTIDLLAPPKIDVTTALKTQPSDQYPYAFIETTVANNTPYPVDTVYVTLEKSKLFGLPDYERDQKVIALLPSNQSVKVSWQTLFNAPTDIAVIHVQSPDFSTIDSLLSITKTPHIDTPYLTQSDTQLQKENYLYITLNQAPNAAVDNTVIIEFDPNYLNYSRSTPSAWILNPDLKGSISPVELPSLTPPTPSTLTVTWKKAAQNTIMKAHFKAIKSGTTLIQLKTLTGELIQTLNVDIVDPTDSIPPQNKETTL